MLNLPLLNQRGRRLFLGPKALQDVCDRQWVICPGETSWSPPAIYLKHTLDRVIQVQAETTVAFEQLRIDGGMRSHHPTIAYGLRKAHLFSGYVYHRSLKIPLTLAPEVLFDASPIAHYSEAALACTLTSNRYFSHWITDGLTLTLVAQTLAPPVTTAKPLTPHQEQYRQILGIEAEAVTNAQFQELILLDDFGQNQSKRDRYEVIRAKLTQSQPLSSQPGVMILRGKTGVPRSLVNEAEVADWLRDRGFTILNPEDLTVPEIVRATVGAKIVVGVEGSHLVHGLFTLADQGAMLVLQPPHRFNNLFKDYTDCLGFHYGFVVGSPVAAGQADQAFAIDLEDLAKTLDRIERKLD